MRGSVRASDSVACIGVGTQGCHKCNSKNPNSIKNSYQSATISVENRTKHDLQNKLKWFILHIFKLSRKSVKRSKSSNLGAKSLIKWEHWWHWQSRNFWNTDFRRNINLECSGAI